MGGGAGPWGWEGLKWKSFESVEKQICDKIGLIARKYMFLFNNMHLHFCVCYNNSVSFSKISIKVYVSDEKGK